MPKEIEKEMKLIPATNGFHRPHSVSNVNSKYFGDNNYTAHNIRIALSQPILITTKNREHTTKSFGSGFMNRRDIFYQGSVDNLRKRPLVIKLNFKFLFYI